MHRVLDLCIHQNANKQVKVLEEAPRNGEQGPFTPFKTPNLRKAEFEQRYREPQLFWCVSRLTTSFGASPPQKRNYSASFAVTSGAPYQRACFCLAFR
ncbi:hypothetical protein MTP99_009790 [Tenebrio molitor]|jgi:hypothetical protein|nr:hypothetical protein MTP99_009790 [Tenebrio molitor]